MKLTARRQQALQDLNLMDSEAILNHFPVRYQRFCRKDYRQWQLDENVLFEGTIVSPIKFSRFKGNQNVEYFDVQTEDDILHVSCFNRIWLLKNKIGDRITIYGKYSANNKILALQSWQQPVQSLEGIFPVYSLKDKLKDKEFNQIVMDTLQQEKGNLKEWIPQDLLNRYQYLNRYESYLNIHQPQNEEKLLKSIQRIKYEEFLCFNLQMLLRHQQLRQNDSSYRKAIDLRAVDRFIASLPFSLTQSQKEVLNDINRDLQADKAMLRLLQGDVGCGKTIVAFCAMVATVSAGYQSLLMAPTEILALQHYENLLKYLKNSDEVVLLRGSLNNAERAEALKRIENCSARYIIGTHALFQDGVQFQRLGLIITDEQQRFGVEQRKKLALKGDKADILMMSATPIPRTLANTLYGELDVSTIDTMPNQNKRIMTRYLQKNSFIPVIDEIEQLLKEGNQMYVVCPAIENNGSTRNVKDIFHNLKKYFANRYEVDLLHGQMSEEDKQEVQQLFKENKVQILVCTTVVEVGVDVANANIMIIYDAHHFGLSQLHQLRGRVGRSEKPGYCYLLSDDTEEQTVNKLSFMQQHMDGFEIALYDLKMRGPGDLIGNRQSGLPMFVLGNIVSDEKILYQSRKDAEEILNQHAEEPLCKEMLDKISFSADEKAFL